MAGRIFITSGISWTSSAVAQEEEAVRLKAAYLNAIRYLDMVGDIP
ncbi:hypothetical protein [Lacrimispora sp.]